ncbi:MAG: hypothetical protein AAFW98_04115 [Pseudomonadota bacterium]
MTALQKTPGTGGSMAYVKAGSFDAIEYSQNHLNLKGLVTMGVYS